MEISLENLYLDIGAEGITTYFRGPLRGVRVPLE